MPLAITGSLLVHLVLWETCCPVLLPWSPGAGSISVGNCSMHLEQEKDVREEVSELTNPGLSASLSGCGQELRAGWRSYLESSSPPDVSSSRAGIGNLLVLGYTHLWLELLWCFTESKAVNLTLCLVGTVSPCVFRPSCSSSSSVLSLLLLAGQNNPNVAQSSREKSVCNPKGENLS